ncbi:RdgB/HAM1 family non-canonical purine NTP pyrophosphatase [Alkalisalibacterium limincola]|uniref:dITP/XTP pyrophosphatase n=1 Tax=Alkalisalibacterium limincola TaxID=2699169 RepID=A0A5C8KSG8_9GAMM|nr:RdgB/HAM1 family non-canonical purine NTP pyrophosphatase [Alkalisalibacterium limincola]TXK62508.1 RdgB/HAM1 family non-canonical purine NTP pyrophosphatase [Alkalisalibacterium limincola]
MTTRLVVATGNPGKLAELRALLDDAGIAVDGQDQHGVGDVEEDGLTFLENALIKARHAARATGLPALADDSGLIVDALGGEPGLKSARFAGSPVDHAANNALLLERLQGVVPGRRTARFYCVLVLLRHAEDPQPLIAEGIWPGRILEAAQGEGGFGYDPLFEVPGHRCSAAQLGPEAKNRLSHRGRALARLLERLREQPL